MSGTRDVRHGSGHEREHVLDELDGKATKRLLRLVGNGHFVHSLAVASQEPALDLHAVAIRAGKLLQMRASNVWVNSKLEVEPLAGAR
jgi:hypothetical protein